MSDKTVFVEFPRDKDNFRVVVYTDGTALIIDDYDKINTIVYKLTYDILDNDVAWYLTEHDNKLARMPIHMTEGVLKANAERILLE